MMDYLITLDGPNHLYNSAIYNRLLSGDEFSSSLFEFNNQITPNYSSLLILSFLLIFFNGVIALKIFHVVYVLLFAITFYKWNQTSSTKHNLSFLIIPLIFSYLFISGFYNFALSFILLFWIISFYEKTKLSLPLKTIILVFLLLTLYLSHSIVFIFAGLALIIYEINLLIIKKTQFKRFIFSLLILFCAAIPSLLLSLFFMSARESELSFLDFSVLLENLVFAKSIFAKGDWSVVIKSFFLLSLFICVLLGVKKKLNLKFNESDYLLWTAMTILVLYFTLPDSVGFAMVFSVRIEYFFWVFLIAWISRIDFDNVKIKIGLATTTIIILSFQLSGNISFWGPLNLDTKKILAAQPHINEKSIVYPIFTSNVWEHFHLSNIVGVDKNIFILDNNGARQDYFPLKYKQPYEKYIDTLPGLQIKNTDIQIEYVLKIGKNPAEIEKDIIIYNSIQNNGTLVFENDLVELWQKSKKD